MVLVIFAVVKFSCFYLFIYYLYLTSAVLYSYLCGLFIGLCASAMFNSHFSLVIGVFDKPKKVIKSRDFVRVIRTINNIISDQSVIPFDISLPLATIGNSYGKITTQTLHQYPYLTTLKALF